MWNLARLNGLAARESSRWFGGGYAGIAGVVLRYGF